MAADQLPDEANMKDLADAHDFINTLLPSADGCVQGGYPWWHGWALRDAYLAGLKAAREERKVDAR